MSLHLKNLEADYGAVLVHGIPVIWEEIIKWGSDNLKGWGF